MDRYFGIVESRFPAVKQLLIDAAKLQSPSEDTAAINAVGECFAAYAKEQGFCVRRIPFPHAADCFVIETNQEMDAPGVVLLAHMDTVHPKGAFGPQIVTDLGDRLVGPGVADCKGGGCVAMLAMEALRKGGYRERPLKLLLTSDEEVNAQYSGPEAFQAFVEAEVTGAAAALNCETGRLDNGLVVERKGIWHALVRVHGKAMHAGTHYDQGVNAVLEAAHKIIEIESGSDSRGITYSCGVIRGGETPNTIAETCTFTIDVRFFNTGQMENAMRRVQETVKRNVLPGAWSACESISLRPPMEKTEAGMALFERFRAGAEKAGLPAVHPVTTGGGSDAAYTVMAGVPSLCGLGIVGGNVHAAGEYAVTDTLGQRAKLLIAGILEV